MIVHDPWTLDSLLEAYKHHQRSVRGLRGVTLQSYERIIRSFLRFALGEDPIDPALLTPAHVMQFVLSFQDRFSPRSMKALRSPLRSLFRFLQTKGYCNNTLERAIPAVAHWRLSSLPRCITDQQIEQVLDAFDLTTPCGLRDRAMVSCLATLGLRPQELAALQLEDIDWREGVVRLRTRKSRRGAVLPLPRESGRAIVSYLRTSRPSTEERRVFVQHLGQHRGAPLSGHTISEVVARALRRAKVDAPLKGPYVFRHTVASRLLAGGARLKEVADFLGHHCLDTTTVYAKVDRRALGEVALAWPQVRS
jgi:site-specific recombinase XerD